LGGHIGVFLLGLLDCLQVPDNRRLPVADCSVVLAWVDTTVGKDHTEVVDQLLADRRAFDVGHGGSPLGWWNLKREPKLLLR
jgi:hypothetical protein